ncbi:hypothetical protein KY275_21370 [Enterobacter hormaechei]|uniref:primase-helicase zinc-binding domain-containing protein n=1 Tax=Enterobacter hormaechei TaxID=158836 RepID=UPI001C5B99ED|nr:hypothetical protein KY275_21370 [Enterobacter hormaechei]
MSIIVEIKNVVAGNWPCVLNALGVHVPEKQSHSPCPVCGGKDRFHWKGDVQGTCYCRGCEKWRDGVQLARDCGFSVSQIASAAGINTTRHAPLGRRKVSLPPHTIALLAGKQKLREQGSEWIKVRLDCQEAAILWHEYEKNGRPFEETRRLYGLHRNI